MRKPCTDCQHNHRFHIKPKDGSRAAVWHKCNLYHEYYVMIANCVDYAEYLAWQRVNRKKKLKENNYDKERTA